MTRRTTTPWRGLREIVAAVFVAAGLAWIGLVALVNAVAPHGASHAVVEVAHAEPLTTSATALLLDPGAIVSLRGVDRLDGGATSATVGVREPGLLIVTGDAAVLERLLVHDTIDRVADLQSTPNSRTWRPPVTPSSQPLQPLAGARSVRIGIPRDVDPAAIAIVRADRAAGMTATLDIAYDVAAARTSTDIYWFMAAGAIPIALGLLVLFDPQLRSRPSSADDGEAALWRLHRGADRDA